MELDTPLLGGRSRLYLRQGRRLIFIFLAGAGAFLGLDGFASTGPRGALLDGRGRAADDAAPTADELRGYNSCAAAATGEVTCTLDPRAFLEFGSVRASLARSGVKSDAEALDGYLPRAVVTTWDPALVGDHFDGGRVAYALYLPSGKGSNATVASYVVVAALDGTPRNVVEARDWDDGVGSTHVDGLKVLNPDALLLNSNEWDTEYGRGYAWTWDGGGLMRFNDNLLSSSHDIQMAYEPDSPLASSYWIPAKTKLRRVDTDSGEILEMFAFDSGDHDMNHCQLIDGDDTAILSFRLTNGVKRYHLGSRQTIWTAGGSEGTLDVVDEAGTNLGPHATLWRGQHNAEWFGDDTFYAFDNQYNTTRPSRVVKVEVDTVKNTATLAWSYVFFDAYPEGQSGEFGDADLLPSGNVLASWWPGKLKPAAGLDFDVQMIEVTEDKRRAWSMSFINAGPGLEGTDGLDRDTAYGWKLYSAERFYDAPVVDGDAARLSGGALAFTAHSAFKRQNTSPASWRLTDANGVEYGAGGFDFPAYWRGADVAAAVDVPDGVDDLALAVTDEFGRTRRVRVARR